MEFALRIIGLVAAATIAMSCSNGDGITNYQLTHSAPESKNSFVAQNGWLQVSGSQIQNQQGEQVQLKGVSSHGIQWFGKFVNEGAMRTLRDDWGLTVFRVAMYTGDGGYIANPKLKNKVYEAVDAAIKLGIYVIIDWHILNDSDPNIYKWQSKAFFQEMSARYKNDPNVIYEICNEPNGGATWSGHIKPYADEIISAIRANGANSLVIVGTPTWSQEVDKVIEEPLQQYNVSYAVHFYSGAHTQWLRDRIGRALNANISVFISEWGTSGASGDGGPYLEESANWMNFLNSSKVSWVAWSLSDKWETSASLKPGANPWGSWNDGNITESGRFIKSYMKLY